LYQDAAWYDCANCQFLFLWFVAMEMIVLGVSDLFDFVENVRQNMGRFL